MYLVPCIFDIIVVAMPDSAGIKTKPTSDLTPGKIGCHSLLRDNTVPVKSLEINHIRARCKRKKKYQINIHSNQS